MPGSSQVLYSVPTSEKKEAEEEKEKQAAGEYSLGEAMLLREEILPRVGSLQRHEASLQAALAPRPTP